MKTSFEIGADLRGTQGKGASRRLRRSGKVPAILYGGGEGPANITLDQQNLLTMIDNEKFYSSIVVIKAGDKKQPAIVKDVQMHPAKNLVVHVDLQRVNENEPIRIKLPIHFVNQASCPGVKLQGGLVSHLLSDIEVVCLPKDLPEFLEMDMATMNNNETRYLSDMKIPEGVTIPAMARRNEAVVSIHSPRAEEPEAAAEAAAAPAEGAAAPAADAKAEPAKKEPAKK